ncbi:MAG: hypothetical protein J6X28_02365 [Bacilli bacterium]|nr:hypothetical protein [Bacilli bacterium]
MNKGNEKQKLKRYERLGALKFQKLVFLVEKGKFLILKKCFPNFIHHYDKYCDWQKKRALKRAKTEEERKAIIENTKLAKMAMRKELTEEKNRNYHMDPKRPTEIIHYLEWNKNVHKKGLMANGILIPIFLAGTILQIPLCPWLLGFEILSAAVNFECINIQNYNLCRLKTVQPALKRREEQTIQKNIEEFGEAAAVIHKSIEESESLPSFQEILDHINTPEQLRQMRAMFYREQVERQRQKQIGGK